MNVPSHYSGKPKGPLNPNQTYFEFHPKVLRGPVPVTSPFLVCFIYSSCFETGSYVAQANLKLVVLLPQPPEKLAL